MKMTLTFAVMMLAFAEMNFAFVSRLIVSEGYEQIKFNSTTTKRELPCNCEANGGWTQTNRTIPKCIFIDLGAADGNTFKTFLKNGFGTLADCPSNTWEAWLVEANPRFDPDLKAVEKSYPQQVHALSATAAFMCEATVSFYLDTVDKNVNYWGSSLSPSHPDVVRSGGKESVTVPTINVNRLIVENTIPGDHVMLKVDIEGSEWDITPCLAKDAVVPTLIDRLFVEVHPVDWSLGDVDKTALDAAKKILISKGVDIHDYSSPTL